MAPKILFLFAISFCLVVVSQGYPHGAPQETCTLFTANHTGVTAQNSEPVYEIIIDPTSVPSGGKATVTIQGVGDEQFKGFFIQGQDENDKPVGKFSKGQEAQTRDCSGPGSSTAATHTDAKLKRKITLSWQAPASYKGKVVFRAVVVKTYEIFWDNLMSSPITVV